MSIFKRDNSEHTESTDNASVDKPPAASEKISIDDAKPQSKMDKARTVFAEMFGKEGIQRKDLIEKFINDCELTKAGAGTYYAKLKKEHLANTGDSE